MSQVQSGILPEHCRVAIWTEANVKGEVDAPCVVSKILADKLATFEAKSPDAHPGTMVIFGNNTWRALSDGIGAEELKGSPGYGKGLAPATQSNMLIRTPSLCHDVSFSVAQMAVGAFGDYIETKEEIHGFRRVEERGLSGLVDGIENPTGKETRREVAVIRGDVDTGGSYVSVQCWGHNLKQLNRMSIHNQETMIGRTKEANEEIDGDERSGTFHLTRVDLKEDGKRLKIARQSLPCDTASGIHGLYLCTYCTHPYNIEQQLLSMSDDIDDKRDTMLRFIEPVTGGYYFVPSLGELMVL